MSFDLSKVFVESPPVVIDLSKIIIDSSTSVVIGSGAHAVQQDEFDFEPGVEALCQKPAESAESAESAEES